MTDQPFSFADAKPAKGGTQTAARAAPLVQAEVPRRRGSKPVATPPASREMPSDDFLQVVKILTQHDPKTARRMIRALMEFWG